MRTLVLLMLLCAVGAVPAAQPSAERPKEPTDAELEELVATAVANRGEKGEKAAAKLVEFGPRAVPALTQGLWGDRAGRQTCATLLGAVGADARPAVPSLARALGDDSPAVRLAAARALGAVGGHAAVPALTKALDDREPRVRLAAAEALIESGARPEVVLPALTRALGRPDADGRFVAIRLLGKLGPQAAPAVPGLVELLPAADAETAAALAETLGAVGPGAKEALPALRSKLKEDAGAARFRVPAALALWRVARDPDAPAHLRTALDEGKGPLAPHGPLWRIDRSKETVAALEVRLEADDPSEVMLAARTLGTASKEAVPALVKLFEAREANRDAVLRVLGELGPDVSGKALFSILDRAARRRSPDALVALYRLAPDPARARAVTDLLEDRAAARLAAEALKELKARGPAVVLELVAALDNPDPAVRLPVAVALWRIEQHPKALPAVVKLLRDADPRVRDLAAVDLGGEFGPGAADAVPELVKRLFDPFAAVRSASAEALGRVGPGARAAVPPLLTLLDGDEPWFVQSAACEALGLIPADDKAGVAAALKGKLGHPDPLVRVHAALALARVANDHSGAKQLEEGLGWRTYPVRITAAEGLWRLNKDARVVPLLVRALEDANLEGTPYENERYMLARALGRIGADAKPAVPELTKLLKHRDGQLVATAAAALKAIDPEAAKRAGVK